MEQITIFFKKEVLESFNELVFELYSKNYFASLDYAIDYKDKLVSFINNSISSFPHKITPFEIASLHIPIKEPLGMFFLKNTNRFI